MCNLKKISSSKIKKLSRETLKNVGGGMKHTDCWSYNVIDRRPGAEAEWIQKAKVLAHNIQYSECW
jgi:hypothetical protein